MLRHRLGKKYSQYTFDKNFFQDYIKNFHQKQKSRQSNLKIGKRFIKKKFTKDMVMANEHMKSYSIALVIRKGKLNPYITLHPLEWLTKLIVGKDMEQLELRYQYIGSGSENWHNHFGKQFDIFL